MSFASKEPYMSPTRGPSGVFLSKRIQNFPPDGLCSSMSKNLCQRPSSSFLMTNSSMGECSMSAVAFKYEHRSWSGSVIFSDNGGTIDHMEGTVEATTEALSESWCHIAVW